MRRGLALAVLLVLPALVAPAAPAAPELERAEVPAPDPPPGDLEGARPALPAPGGPVPYPGPLPGLGPRPASHQNILLDQVVSKSTSGSCAAPPQASTYDVSDTYANSWISYHATSTPIDIDWYYQLTTTGETVIWKRQTHTAGPGAWCWENWQALYGTALQAKPGTYEVEVYFNGVFQCCVDGISIWPKIVGGGTYRSFAGDGVSSFNWNDVARSWTDFDTSAMSYTHSIAFRWERPDGTQHRVGPSQNLPRFYSSYRLEDSLDLAASGACAYPGTWRVRPWIDSNNYFHQANFQFTVGNPPAPGAPASLDATSGPGAGQIRLTWQAASGCGVSNYKIYRGTISGAETHVATVGNVLSYTDSGLQQGTTYFYQVSAVGPGGEGPRSNRDSAQPPTGPGAPPNLAAAAGPGVGQVTLTWQAASGAPTSYKVYRGTASGGETFLANVGNVLSHTDSGLAEGTRYYYQVSAVNGVGEGPRSNEASARTFTRPGPPQNLVANTGPGEGQITLAWQAPADSGGPPVGAYNIYRGTAPGEETPLVTNSNPGGAAYTFDASAEGFAKASDYPASDVGWDSALRRVRVLSQRTDAGDERFERSLPSTLTTSTSFTLTARWAADQQGNWQSAHPLYAAGSGMTRAYGQPNTASVLYGSQDSFLQQRPRYYLLYFDNGGVARMSLSNYFEGLRNTIYQFELSYDAASRALKWTVRDAAGLVVFNPPAYVIGSNANDGFTFTKVGVSSRGTGEGNEPAINAWVDDIALSTGFNSLTFTDSGLGTGTYYYQVAAVNTMGEGARSNEASALAVSSKAPPVTPDDAYEASFDEGPDDWSGAGLWHRVAAGENPYPNAYTQPGAWWFGRDATGTYEASGVATGGTLVSPAISLTNTPNPMLTFASWYETEDQGVVWDTKKVYLSTNGGNSWVLLGQVAGPHDYRRWGVRAFDLTPWSGLTVQLRFEFGTADALFNGFRGWYVDNVRIFRDDDHDGLSPSEEARTGASPTNADSDGDGLRDGEDRRPAVEDVPPTWTYVGTDRPIGQVTFYPEDGFIDVVIEAPTDNAGVQGVDFATELHGAAGGQARESTARVSLNPGADGKFYGRLPLPRNFNLGQATLEKFAVIPKDVNGNRLGVEFTAQETIRFDVPWQDRTTTGWAKLELADIEASTQGQAAMQARTYHIVLPRGLPEAPATLLDDAPASPRSAQFPSAPADAGPVVELVFQGEDLVPRERVLSFHDGLLNQVWAGVKSAWVQHVEPELKSFVFGSDSNGHVLGDVVAGILVYGDVRDVVLGALEGDEIQFTMGVVGLGMTFTGPGDAVYSALKAAVKAVPTALAKLIVKEAGHVVDEPLALVDDLTRLTGLAKYVATDAAKAARFQKFYNAFPTSHPLLKLATEADLRSIDAVLTKYDGLGIDVLAKFKAAGSRLNDPEAFLKAARAEQRFGGSIANDAGDLAGVNGVERVLANLDTATQRSGKGYAYELGKAAGLKRAGNTIDEMNRFHSVTFVDADGVTRTARLDVDAALRTPAGRRIYNEMKDRASLPATKDIKNQVLKMERAVQTGLADEARIWTKSASAPSQPLKDFAKAHGVKLYDDAGNVLNP